MVLSLFRWNQGSPAWNVVFNLGDHLPVDSTCGITRISCPRVVATYTSWGAGISGNCHGSLPAPCSRIFPMRWQGIHGFGQGEKARDGTMGPFQVVLNQSAGLNATDSTDIITVTSNVVRGGMINSPCQIGDPLCQSLPPDGGVCLDQALPGDFIEWDDRGNEWGQVLARNSATSLTIARGCHAAASPNYNKTLCDGTGEKTHANAATFHMEGAIDLFLHGCSYWDFVGDPHGKDTTSTNVVLCAAFAPSHWSATNPYIIEEGPNIKNNSSWNGTFFPSIWDFSDAGAGVPVPFATYAGTSCPGAACLPYPHYYPADSSTETWMWDPLSYSGGLNSGNPVPT